MELIVIGSGTGVPRAARGAPALAVRVAGRLVLLDMGSGTLRSLDAQGIDFNDIDVICLSHFHPDHIGDLMPFLFATRYALGYRRAAPVRLLTAAGGRDLLGRLQAVLAPWLEPPPGLLQHQELSPTAPDCWSEGELVIQTAPVNHTPASLAWRLEAAGASLVYSGDTDVCDSLVNLARGADVLVLECSFPTKVAGHLTPHEAGRLAAAAGVPRLVLTHFYPPCDEIDVRQECARFFPGEIILATDGLRLMI